MIELAFGILAYPPVAIARHGERDELMASAGAQRHEVREFVLARGHVRLSLQKIPIPAPRASPSPSPSQPTTASTQGGTIPHFWTIITAAGLTTSPPSGAISEGATITITLTWLGRGSLSIQILINLGDHPLTVQFTAPASGALLVCDNCRSWSRD